MEFAKRYGEHYNASSDAEKVQSKFESSLL